MKPSLKSLLAELHTAYFKPNGFKKERQRFRRDLDSVMQVVEFQSSAWNAADGPVTFYVNFLLGFADIPIKDGKPELTGSGRIQGLVPQAPAQFDLTHKKYESIRQDLLVYIPLALVELPKHYEDVRSRAQTGLYTPIPLPKTWQA
jgi:hypothetical protein